jgi:YaaC-like Protein
MGLRSGPGDAREVTKITASTIPAGYGEWLEIYDGAVGWPFAVDVVLQRETDASSWISPWGAQLAGMYILASVARYQPTLWGRLLGRQANSSVLALVEAFLSVAEHEFPRKALEILERVTVVKGSITTFDRLIVGSLP